MKYFDAFGEGGFHSAFMTTYAFGSLAFEDIPFPKLRGAGCRNIVVLADTGMVNQAFSDFGPPRFAGTSYHLIKTSVPGAFHPKITMLLGETKARLMVGSANLTALGLGGNKEQVASITWSAESPENAKFFMSAIAYFRRYVPADDQWFSISLQRALRSSPWLRDDTSNPAFRTEGTEALNLLFDRPEITILDQIVDSIGDDAIERLIVVSPYWDSKLEGVARLKAGLGDPATDILIEDDANGFPSSELPRFSDVALFDISPNAAGRFLHAKLIIALGKEFDHVISGSMNCTLPALTGPAFGGNAEAGIYKRVVRGSALVALGLSDYEDSRFEKDQLARLEETFDEIETTQPSVDGGLLTLQAGKVTWTAPKKLPSDPQAVQLYDREGEALALIDIGGAKSAAHTIAPASQRPKYGVLTFVDDTASAPIQVTDLDYLAVTTLPPQKGRKKRLMDTLAETIHEDLALIEALNQLEAIEDEDRSSHSITKTKPQVQEEAAREYSVLPYEEFIRARTLANAQGKPFGLYLNSRHDRAVNLVSHCLNQMIGLVGPDLGESEEKDIQALSVVDFRTTEPQSQEDGHRNNGGGSTASRITVAPSQILATAKKFQEAVVTFEKRSKALVDKRISTSELVRLRALMQIILSHAQPLSGPYSASQVLPVYIADGYDWPRLIGRLLQQHFGATRALQNLTIENDEAEHQRAIEYLALSKWSAKAALAAVMTNKKATSLRVPLERLLTSLLAQTRSILSLVESDQAYFDEMTGQLDQRFQQRLGLGGSVAN
ncbi:hypothetical protein ASE85_21730 [Sphingobium sp. Leaf26]|uniref:hypothetical protein n=1 Tax=Sphingobium sp. Leaf26 TaxID=1735693 RepID=UPI0006F994F2|nr:hypothetical protein [Sphingobium sp. Leaf26]KQN01813.1 hypothetical protein ASE85_21730 [Sphingobium sp. Leaf26]